MSEEDVIATVLVNGSRGNGVIESHAREEPHVPIWVRLKGVDDLLNVLREMRVQREIVLRKGRKKEGKT